MVHVGLQVPTPLVMRKGVFSWEFLTRLQELCLHSSLCIINALASLLCQVNFVWLRCGVVVGSMVQSWSPTTTLAIEDFHVDIMYIRAWPFYGITDVPVNHRKYIGLS